MATAGQSGHLKRAFLEEFRLHGNVTLAAERTGVPRSTVYAWRERDRGFAADFQRAEVESTERMEAEAWRRAMHGVTRERPIFHQGEQVGTEVITEYSDTLLIFQLKARAPEKYRDNMTVRREYRGEVNVKHEHSLRADPDNIAAILGILAESGALPAGAGPVIDAEAYEVHPAYADAETGGIPMADGP